MMRLHRAPNIVAALLGLLVVGSAHASAAVPACRQNWMPPDSPALCPWEAEPPLPDGRTYQAIATSSHAIYVLGGYRYDATAAQVIYDDSVLRASIGADTHLSNWSHEPAFTTARSGAAAVTFGDCIFLSGGSSSTASSVNYYDDVQSAHIQGDGSLTAWTTQSKSPQDAAVESLSRCRSNRQWRLSRGGCQRNADRLRHGSSGHG